MQKLIGLKVSEMENPKITDINQNRHNKSLQATSTRRDNTGGGEPPMNDNKYVTHEELKLTEAHIDSKFEQVNTKFEQVNTKFEQVNTKFAQMDGKIDRLSDKIDAQSKVLWWLMGLVGAGIIIPLLVLVYKAVF